VAHRERVGLLPADRGEGGDDGTLGALERDVDGVAQDLLREVGCKASKCVRRTHA